jgi:hypothetical protein
MERSSQGTGRRIWVTSVVASIGAILWGVPLAINTLLVFDQYRQNSGSLFLIGIGILPFAVALYLLRFARSTYWLLVALPLR